jgi:hypothetical protein
MTIPQVSTIGQAFVKGLKRILGEKLYAAYIFGAAAFPDAVPTGDVDFHVILQSELTEDERSELETFHESLAEQFPSLGGEMDGYYILLSDARRTAPPRSQMWKRASDDSWALHREHMRAGRRIVLYGPEPREASAGLPRLLYPQSVPPDLQFRDPGRRRLQSPGCGLGSRRPAGMETPRRVGQEIVCPPGDGRGPAVYACRGRTFPHVRARAY